MAFEAGVFTMPAIGWADLFQGFLAEDTVHTNAFRLRSLSMQPWMLLGFSSIIWFTWNMNLYFSDFADIVL